MSDSLESCDVHTRRSGIIAICAIVATIEAAELPVLAGEVALEVEELHAVARAGGICTYLGIIAYCII